ncbi:MAG: hypothetical protein COC12_01850 [Rhodobacteraceae bacterium]|nr:MAG: hypothetical protein COC12_01850 [Paracoccaceae bacterium]
MPFGGADNPLGRLELGAQEGEAPAQPPRPLVQVVADGNAAQQARLQTETAHQAQEEPEKSRADILVAVQTDWDYFGQVPKNDKTAEDITDILLEYQAFLQSNDPSYVLGKAETQEELKTVALRGIKRLGDRRRRDEAEVTEVTTKIEEKSVKELTEAEKEKAALKTEETEAQTVKSLEDYEELLASPKLQGLSNTQRIAALLKPENVDKVPTSERTKLQAFSRILAIADAVPEDAAIIRQRLNQADFSKGVPSPMAFIQSAIFSSPEQDSGVSEATQNAVAAEFNLTPRSIVTGGDLGEALGETRVDKNGETVPAYPEDEPLKFGVGLEGYTSDNGQEQFIKSTPTYGQAITINVTKFSANEKAIAASYLDAWRMAEDAGQTDFLLSLTQYDIRGQSIIDPIQLIAAAQVVNALYGGRTGYNGEVLRGEGRVGMTRWQAQLASPKGDAARSDRNVDMSLSAMQGLGIQDQNGNIDLDVLKAFGDYSRDNWFSAPNYTAVQKHLADLFPEKFSE